MNEELEDQRIDDQRAGSADAAAADSASTDEAVATSLQPRGTAAAQAASRARRIGGRPRPGPGPSATSAGSGAGPATDRPSVLASVASVGANPVRAGSVDLAEPLALAAEPAARQSRRGMPGWLVALQLTFGGLLVAGLIVGVVLAALSFHSTSSAKSREQLLAQVQQRVVPAITYDYRHLQADEKLAEAGLTGTFEKNYAQSMQTVIIPQAPKLKAVITAQVSSVGLQSMSSDGKQAVVLVFAQQNTQNSANPTPRPDFATLDVTANYVHGQWLISQITSVP